MKQYRKFLEETTLAKKIFESLNVTTDVEVISFAEWTEELKESTETKGFYSVKDNKVFILYGAAARTGEARFSKIGSPNQDHYAALGTGLIAVHELAHVLDEYLKEEVPLRGTTKRQRVETFVIQKGLEIISKLPNSLFKDVRCDLNSSLSQQKRLFEKAYLKECEENLYSIEVKDNDLKAWNEEFAKDRSNNTLTRSN